MNEREKQEEKLERIETSVGELRGSIVQTGDDYMECSTVEPRLSEVTMDWENCSVTSHCAHTLC